MFLYTVNKQATTNAEIDTQVAHPQEVADREFPAFLPKYARPLAIIFFIGIFARVFNYHDVRKSLIFDNYFYLADAWYYDQRADAIVGGDLWGDEVFFMAPLYEYFLAGIYLIHDWVFSNSTSPQAEWVTRFDLAIYLQCVLGALTCCILFWMGRRLFGPLGGWVAGLISCLYGPFILFDSLLMPTTLVLFLNVLMLAVLICANQKDRPSGWLIGGVSVGLASVAHGLSLFVAPAMLMVFLGRLWKGQKRETIAKLLAFLFGVLLPISPITVRNYIVGKDMVLLTSNAGMNFFIGNNSTANGTHIIYDYPYRLAALKDYAHGVKRLPDDPSPSQVSRSIANEALVWIRENPKEAITLWGKKLAMFFNVLELGRNDNYQFFRNFSRAIRWPHVSFGIVVPLGLAGMVCLLPRWRDLLFIYLVFFTQVAAVVMMFVLGRYRFPAVACLVLLAAGQVAWFVHKIRNQKYRLLIASIILISIFGLGVHGNIEGFDHEHGMGRNYAWLGKKLDEKGLKSDAIQAYAEALKLRGTDGKELLFRYECWRRAGELYWENGDSVQAIHCWETARWEIGNEIEKEKQRVDLGPIVPFRIPLDVLRTLENELISRLRSAYSAKKGRDSED